MLRAHEPTREESEGDGPVSSRQARSRALSEGANAARHGANSKPALCRTPRRSQDGKKRFRSRQRSQGQRITDEVSGVVKSARERTTSRRRRSHPRKQPEEEPPEQLVSESTFNVEDDGEKMHYDDKPLSPKWGLKVHFSWLLCSIAFAIILLLGVSAFKMGSGAGNVHKFGDSACWKGPFTPELCCLQGGPRGNPTCWDDFHTYARCCLPKDEV